jgi:hypothetical protein
LKRLEERQRDVDQLLRASDSPNEAAETFPTASLNGGVKVYFKLASSRLRQPQDLLLPLFRLHVPTRPSSPHSQGGTSRYRCSVAAARANSASVSIACASVTPVELPKSTFPGA